MIFKLQLQSVQVPVAQRAPPHYPAPRIFVHIAAEFRCRGHDPGRLGDTEPQLDGHIAYRAARHGDVRFRFDLDFALIALPHCGYLFLLLRGRPAMSSARSTLSAVRVFPSVTPNSVAVIATEGRIPAIMVSPPIRPTICAVSATVRAK